MSTPHDPPTTVEIVKDAPTQDLHIPFSAKGKASNMNGHAVNGTRIVEAIIIGAITTFGMYIVTIPRLEQKVENNTRQLQEIKSELHEIRHDLYQPFTHTGKTPPKGGADFDGN